MFFLTGRAEFNPKPIENSIEFKNEYTDKKGINLAFIAANKIANYVVTDSSITISCSSSKNREELLNKEAGKLWGDIKLLTSRAFGGGKYCVFPYFNGVALSYDYIWQERIGVLEYIGEKPVDIVILCDKKKKAGKEYFKFRRYKLEGNIHTISDIFSNGYTFSQVSPISDWQEIEAIAINNVDRLLFGSIDCPVDPRREDKFYRSKLTDGADDIIADIQEQFKYLSDEYKLKASKIFADRGFLGVDEKTGEPILTKDNIYAMYGNGGTEAFFQVFDPEIRFDPIYNRLKFSFELLERQIGVSQGIFSSPENLGSYTNKSNIKRATFDTYALVTEMRANIKNAFEDIIYAINVLAEANNLSPQGLASEYKIDIDWSNAMVEDMSEEWLQYKDLADRGGMDTTELRQWLKGESYEEAKARVLEIAENVPSIDNLLKSEE